jgi:lipopolysaccharide export system ATP-binding protein
VNDAVLPRLSAESITVVLGGRTILRDVTLHVEPGEILGVFGPSGAGKSTLFRALAGEIALDRGRVLIDGVDVTQRPLWQRARAGLGYVPQTPSVLFDLSVAENLAVFQRFASRSTGFPSAEAIARTLGLGNRMDVRAASLSGGERRRLELTRALSVGPRVLLCDEPFSAVDPGGIGKIAEALAVVSNEGTSIVLADHNTAVALPLCRRAALLADGEIAIVTLAGEFSEDDLVRTHYIEA